MLDPRPSTTVVEAVADRKGIEPDALSARLADVIDPDALDKLMASGPTETTVLFCFLGTLVTVTGGGHVTLAESE